MVGRDKLTAGGHIVIAAAGSQVTINAPDLMALGALQREADLRRREEIYLIRFICDETYARWGHDYVPLAGDLRPPGRPSDDLRPAMRYYDRQDANASPGGQHLEDIREAISEYHKTKLILLGQPGAGKTTTLYRLALDFALERLRDPALGKLPLSLSLAKFRKANELPEDFLRAHLETTGLGLSYGEAIAYRQVCFLLDGLNQMPADDRNERIDAWRRWASEPELPREIVAIFACRLADYVPRLALPEVHVQVLDNDRIQKYFHLRFGPETGQKHWRTLHDRLRTGDKLFEDLARNPMMLSKLAERAEEGLSLADSKGIILEDAALRRLDYELGSDNQPPALTANPRRTLREEMDALGRIAYEVQALGEGTVFDDARLEAVSLAKGASLTRAQVKKLAIDSTLLTAHGPENTEPYEFQHQLFQEYFAARELLRRFRAGEDLKGLWEVDWQAPDRGPDDERIAPPPATRWDETVIMAGGLAREDAPRLIAAIRADHPPLAGRALAEARPDERDDLKTLADDLRAELLRRQRDAGARLRARIGAGLALGELGHPDLRPRPFEFEGRTVWAIAPPMQPVPAGEFIRGSDRNDERAFPQEYTTERKVATPAYSIGRYPVTNAEYRFFVEADGYKNDRWWDDEGIKWKQGGPEAHAQAIEQSLASRDLLKDIPDWAEQMRRLGWTQETINFWEEVVEGTDEEARRRLRRQFSRSFDRPAFWEDPTFNSPARPVVGVNWHEAEAYCRWLSAVTGQNYRLPAEMEWEKAARGPSTGSGDGRQYPWEGEFDSARCNTNESRILVTTPVGLYPDGKSPFEVYDASGNVWEWTADWYQAYPGGGASEDFGERFKVVRGGSWNNDDGDARCAYRNRNVPVDFDDNIGFRLLSPVS
jgi:formylglycine-generating enzyme required for sulfatase activity